MKLKRRFAPQQLLFLPALVLLSAGPLLAQDQLVLKDGRTQPGKILGVTGNAVQIQLAAGTVAIPIASLSQVVMAAPPDFAEAVKAYGERNYPKALVNAKGLADKFKGLPVEWAQQATSMLGDIYAVMNDVVKAEAAYKEYQRAYPGAGSSQSDLGIAKVAIMKKDYAGAKPKLEALTAAALKEKEVPKAMAPIYSQAFYLLGQIAEGQGDLPAALENYLRTVTIFPQDRIAAASAQEKADALRKAHPGVTVP